jgi:hypothetical protein
MPALEADERRERQAIGFDQSTSKEPRHARDERRSSVPFETAAAFFEAH